MTEYRQLHEADKEELFSFLENYVETSMFLISNARKVGLEDHGQRYEGAYVGAFEKGSLCGVAAHYWNGVLMTQSPKHEHLESLVPMVLKITGRNILGMTGDLRQVDWNRERFAKEREAILYAPELLYKLSLEQLEVPRLLQSEKVLARLAERSDLELLSKWRLAYRIEALQEKDSKKLRKQASDDITSLHQDKVLWLLEVEDERVAMTAFNAQIPQCVQVGGIYTPLEQRGKSYARSVLAGSLLKAHEQGADSSVLFTNRENLAAQSCYEKLGYQNIGEYGLVLFR